MYACFLKHVCRCKELLDSCCRRPSALRLFLYPLNASVDYHARHQKRHSVFINRLLIYLCDLQIITSLAILIAGLIAFSRGTLSFYHQQLVSNFWNQAINSYWAGRDAEQDRIADRGPLQFKLRIIGILASIALATVFQAIIFRRENYSWDRKQKRPLLQCSRPLCARCANTVASWFWHLRHLPLSISLQQDQQLDGEISETRG